MVTKGAHAARDISLHGRSEVLRAASRCIQRHGVHKTTMDDIAREAGISRPSIYRHFSDREDLLFALTTDHFRALTKRAHAVLARQDSFAERLVEGLLYLAENGHRDELTRFLVTHDDSEVRWHLDACDTAAVLAAEFWDVFLDAAEQDGELRSDLDRRDLHAWLGRIHLLLVSIFDVYSDRHADEYRDFLHRLVVPGFVTATTPSRSVLPDPITG
jgi:AcrR family transcriptional regulator